MRKGKKKKRKLFFFLSRGRIDRQKGESKRTKVTIDAYMIRVGFVSICCDAEIAAID